VPNHRKVSTWCVGTKQGRKNLIAASICFSKRSDKAAVQKHFSGNTSDKYWKSEFKIICKFGVVGRKTLLNAQICAKVNWKASKSWWW